MNFKIASFIILSFLSLSSFSWYPSFEGKKRIRELIARGDVDTLKRLLDNGLNPHFHATNEEDYNLGYRNNNIFHMVADHPLFNDFHINEKNIAALKLFYDRGVDINETGRDIGETGEFIFKHTPLMEVVKHESNFRSEYGMDYELQEGENNDLWCHSKLTRLYLSWGANHQIGTRTSIGPNAFYGPMRNTSSHCKETLEVMLEYGAKVVEGGLCAAWRNLRKNDTYTERKRLYMEKIGRKGYAHDLATQTVIKELGVANEDEAWEYCSL